MEDKTEHIRTASAMLLVDTLPLIMRVMGSEAEAKASGPASITRIRTLMFVHTHPGANLSMLGRFLESSASATSKLVEGMSRQGLLQTAESEIDARQKLLRITEAGAELLWSVREQLGEVVGRRFAQFTSYECELIMLALKLLQSAFMPQLDGLVSPEKPAPPRGPFFGPPGGAGPRRP